MEPITQETQDSAPKSTLDTMLDEAGRTQEFVRCAEKLFSDINDKLLLTRAGQFAIIKRQLDGGIASHCANQRRGNALRWGGHLHKSNRTIK